MTGNVFITPTVIARSGLATLYNATVLLPLVWRDFDADFSGKVGDTVTIRKPAVFEAELFNRANGITLQDAEEDSDTLALDTLPNVSFGVTDEQMTLEVSDFRAQLLTPAMEAIIQAVDGKIAKALVDAADSAGNVAIESGGAASSALIEARTQLSRGKFPATERFAVLSPEGTGEALGDELFVRADQSGSTDALREASLGRVFGFDTYETQVLGVGGAAGDGSADGVAFHRSAVTIAVRPLDTPRGVAAGNAAVESYKGLSLRVVYAYSNTYKRDEVSVDLLCGVKATREEGAVELDLGQGS